jgi:hypothetical protein
VNEDVEKMVMRTRYGSYEFLVMPFGLFNIPLMFTTFMNSIFHEKLDEFVIIYIDDILVYSKIIKEHVEHLQYVFNKLHDKLFVNKAKNEFAQEEMDFLKHILSKEGVKPNVKKLQAIKYWKIPIIIKGI